MLDMRPHVVQCFEALQVVITKHREESISGISNVEEIFVRQDPHTPYKIEDDSSAAKIFRALTLKPFAHPVGCIVFSRRMAYFVGPGEVRAGSTCTWLAKWGGLPSLVNPFLLPPQPSAALFQPPTQTRTSHAFKGAALHSPPAKQPIPFPSCPFICPQDSANQHPDLIRGPCWLRSPWSSGTGKGRCLGSRVLQKTTRRDVEGHHVFVGEKPLAAMAQKGMEEELVEVGWRRVQRDGSARAV